MLISAVSVLIVAQSSSEIPEGLMNNPVLCGQQSYTFTFTFATVTLWRNASSTDKMHDSILFT